MKWPVEQFDGKHVVYIGVGQGRARDGIKAFLEKNAAIASFTSVDKQPGDDPLGFLKEYDPSKTVFFKNEAIPQGEMPVPYTTGTQLFFSLVPVTGAATVGITGTKGKSTTTSLVAHILKTAGKHVVLAGNIGVSPLLSLDEATEDTTFVLEMSSYQLSDLQVSPHVSACLNLYNDHTDWHGSLEGYWEAKHNIMRYAKPEDLFVYNPAFPVLKEWAQHAICRTIASEPTEQIDLSQAQLFGEHNRQNALIARHIARELGVTDNITQAALNSFQPLRHRMQIVATKQGHTYIDDAIGMTPESTMASLRAISEKIGPIGCVLLGGKDRGYDFDGIMEYIAELQVPNIVLFPDTIDKMRAAMPDSYQPDIFETRNMRDAVRYAAEHAPQNSAIVLSTAAPSYSIWRDFEEKGDQFQAAVAEL